MPIIRLDPFFSPRFPFKPVMWEDEERWPELTMTEGLDVFEEEGKVVVKAAVPGVPADKVEVTYEDGVLKISAKIEKREEEKKKKKVVYKRERVASFNYTTVLPRPVDQTKLTAEVKNGVVTIEAPIAKEARPKKISVKTK